jgi:hypothetical protein
MKEVENRVQVVKAVAGRVVKPRLSPSLLSAATVRVLSF